MHLTWRDCCLQNLLAIASDFATAAELASYIYIAMPTAVFGHRH